MSSEFSIKRRVRFGDCDPGGVIYTPNVGFYVVEAVRSFMDSILEAPMERAILDMGILPPARAISIEFESFMKWDDEIDITVSVKDVGTSSFTFSILGHFGATRVFSSKFTQVCVDPESNRPTPIPEKLRELLVGHLHD